MKSLSDFIEEKFIVHLQSSDKYKAIEELAKVFEGSDACGDIDELVRALKEREEIMSTGVGFGLAIPHAKIKTVKRLAFAIGVSKEGIKFDSIDEKPVHLIIMVAAGERQHKEYLRLLSNIMAVLKDKNMREKIIEADSSKEIIDIFKEQKPR